jgi:phosphodiesterase/alkaline phosphatase D-like protein
MLSPLRVTFGKSAATDLARKALKKKDNPTGEYLLNLDQWDGYPTERETILNKIHKSQPQNVVWFTGDLHAGFDAYVYNDSQKLVALEVGTSSITSISLGERASGMFGLGAQTILTPANPHLDWHDLNGHGFTKCIVTPEKMVIEHWTVNSVKRFDQGLKLARRSVIPNGEYKFIGEPS